MRLIKVFSVLIGILVMLMSGCGGGGGGVGNTSTSKSATLVFSSQSNTPTDQIGGFNLTVTLPVGVSIKTDASGTPLSSAVFLSGKFAGSTFSSLSVVSYDATQRILSINYPSTTSYLLGEFLTIICDVPISYTPNINDVSYTVSFFAPITGALLSATAIATFN